MKSPKVILSTFSSNNPILELSSISLLPFQINFDGLAPIKTYFNTRIRNSTSKSLNSQEEEKESTEFDSLPLLEASFRGRQVFSTPINLPKGFSGLIFSTTTPAVAINIDQNEDSSVRNKSNKRIKLSSPSKITEEGKGKGKEIFMASITGRRTSPRKKVAVIKYAMDSDDEEDEDEIETATATEDKMEIEEIPTVQIEITAPSSPLVSPSSSSSSKPLQSFPSISSVFSTPDTPIELESQSTMAETETDKEDSQLVQVNEEKQESIKDVQELIPQAKFNAIQIWNADFELDGQEDVFVKSLTEWIGIGKKIHDY